MQQPATIKSRIFAHFKNKKGCEVRATAIVFQGPDRGYYISTSTEDNGSFNVPGRVILSRTREVRASISIQAFEDELLDEAMRKKVPLND